MFKYINFTSFLKNDFAQEKLGGADREPLQDKEDSKEDLSNLSPEQRQKIEAIDKKIKELEKNIDIKNAGIGVVGKRKDYLESSLEKKISAKELEQDKDEIDKIDDEIFRLKNELKELKYEKDLLLRSVELSKDNKLTSEEMKKMQKITSKEFLNYKDSEKLKFITKGNINGNELKEGGVKDLEFTFTFDGVENEELYLRTTAGQVLPENIRSVSSNGIEYERRGINGEFFAPNGKRLVIHEGTQVEISKFGTDEELKQIHENIDKQLVEYKDNENYDLVSEGIKKGLDPKFFSTLFGDKVKSLQGNDRKIYIQELFTDIAHLQDDFEEDYGSEETFVDGKVGEKFAGYVINGLQTGKEEEISKAYSYNIDTLKNTKRVNNPTLGGGPIDLTKINVDGVSKADIDNILKKKVFTPGSKDAQILFLAACQASKLPTEWCNKESLHKILKSESGGKVGVLNWKGAKMYNNTDSFKQEALKTKRAGTVYNASGLGQLLLSNVDKFYPDGRNGIGDPLNEAVGMIRYIKDRYGDPDIAGEIYGKVGTYVHPQKGTLPKNFKEGY